MSQQIVNVPSSSLIFAATMKEMPVHSLQTARSTPRASIAIIASRIVSDPQRADSQATLFWSREYDGVYARLVYADQRVGHYDDMHFSSLTVRSSI